MNTPEGWKLVPVEPTIDMLNAYYASTETIGEAYKDMLAAAPTPPAQEDEPTLYQARMVSEEWIGAWATIPREDYEILIEECGWEGRKLYASPQSAR